MSQASSQLQEGEQAPGSEQVVPLCVRHGLIHRAGIDDGWHERVHATVQQLGRVGIHATHQCHAGNARPFAPSRHAAHHLAVGRLGVRMALPRHAEVAASEQRVEPYQVKHALDARQHLRGIVEMDHVRKLMFKTDQYEAMRVHDFMEQPAAVVLLDESMESVMEKFDRTQAWRLPVVDADMVYVGFLSKSRIMSAYRTELKEISQD